MSVSIDNIVMVDINKDLVDLLKHACYICTKDDDGNTEIKALAEWQVKDMMKSEGITREEFMEKYEIPLEVLVEFGYIGEGK